MTSVSQSTILSIIINGRDFPGVPWLGLCASRAGGTSSTAGQGTKIPHAMAVAPPQKINCINNHLVYTRASCFPGQGGPMFIPDCG